MSNDLFYEHFDLLAEAPGGTAKLRELILELAVQGRLVDPTPRDDPTEALLNKLREGRHSSEENGQGRQNAGVSPISDGQAPFAAPTNWAWVRFGEIARIAGGVTLGRRIEGRRTATYPYLRVANVQRGRVDLSLVKEVEIPLDELQRYRLEVGDILLTEGGDWDKLGRAAIWRGEIKDCLHQNHIFRARTDNASIRPEWIALYVNSPIGKRYFQEASKQTTNLASINMTQLRNCPIPLPCPQTQDRILLRLRELELLCDELETRQKAKRETRERLVASALDKLTSARDAAEFDDHWHRLRDHFDFLFDHPSTIPPLRQAILQIAVEGRLVKQDPTEEPAGSLLKRIAAERRDNGEASCDNLDSLPPVSQSKGFLDLPIGWAWTRFPEIGHFSARKVQAQTP